MKQKSDIPKTAQKMFENYLYQMGFNKKKMNPIQLQETKRAFYGGISSLMIGQIHCNSESEMDRMMNSIKRDTTIFFNNEVKKHQR